jgi:5'(3')-deoxyribonucleotidase
VKNNFKIFLDMDGVLADFVLGWCSAKGLASPYANGLNGGEWDIAKIFGMSGEAFWEPCNSAEFWANLPWTVDGYEILKTCCKAVGRDDVYLLTSPSHSPESWKGKVQWVQEFLPSMQGRMIQCNCKHVLARPGYVLVDDCDVNIDRWRESGGVGVLVPRPWNKLHARSVSSWIDDVRTAIMEATE